MWWIRQSNCDLRFEVPNFGRTKLRNFTSLNLCVNMARSIWRKIPVWISEIFVYWMERYFPPGRTDLVLFPLEHIAHQELLEKMLRDRDEVADLSAVLSCFVWRSLKSIQNSTLPWYLWEKLTNFSRERVCKPGELTHRKFRRNDQSTIFQAIRS